MTGTHLDGTLEAGSVTEFVTGDPVELTIPGQLRINLHPGAGAGDTQHHKVAASEKLRRLLEQAGVDDVAAARTAETDRQAAISAAQERSVEIKGLLRDLTRESLAAKVERLGDSTRARPRCTTCGPTTSCRSGCRRGKSRRCRRCSDSGGRSPRGRHLSTRGSAFAEVCSWNQAESEGQPTFSRPSGRLTKLRAALDEARTECPDEKLSANLQTIKDHAAKAQEVVDAANARLGELNAESTEELFNNARDALERTKGELRDADSAHTQLSISLRLRGEEGDRRRH